MKLPGQILVENKWIVFISLVILAIVTFQYTTEDAYNEYGRYAPQMEYGKPIEAFKEIFINNLGFLITAMLGPFVISALPAFGFTLGALIWGASVNPVGVNNLVVAVLTFYSLFLSVFGGLFIMVKIGEKIWSKLFSPRDVSLIRVAGDYGSIFIFGVLTLFVSTVIQVLYGQAGESGAPVQDIVTGSLFISLLTIVLLNSNVLRRVLSYLPSR